MIETRLLHDDDPGERLAAFIRSEPDALVCLSTHGRGRIRQTVLGSVAARIVRDGGRPVVMVGPNYEETRPFVLERILVCLYGSSLSEAVIPTALAWAEEHDSSVLLAEVVPPIAEAATAEARIPRASSGQDSYLARLAASLTGPAPVAWVVIADERAEREILQLATEHKASLIVMATHGETGLALVAVGSVATAAACSSPVPVLLVRRAMPAP